MITLRSLEKSYGNKPVLKGIDYAFETGKVYGIVGDNGAGKTTLFRCLTGLEEYHGSITFDASHQKKQLGYLAAENYFLSKITGTEYLRFCCQARDVEYRSSGVMNLFDLPLNEFVENYSTGMKKKIALQAILLQKNNWFILDEPFNGLDMQSNFMMKEIILRLKALGKTMLISSHIFSTLAETCDTIVLLKEGTIHHAAQKDAFGSVEEELYRHNMFEKVAGLVV